MEIAPYLVFNGNCAEAFTLYERVLGGKVTMKMTHGESPAKEQVGPEWQDKIMHVTMAIGKQVIMGSDAPPQHFAKAQGIMVSINVAAYAEAERIFKALADGAKINMPFQKTFWSDGFGMLVDRFGIPWMVGVAQSQS